MSSIDFSIDLQRTDATTALEHWTRAQHTTIFTHPEVLGRLATEVHWWLASSNGEPASLWPICLNQTGQVQNPELAYFIGPIEVTPPEPSPRRRLLRQFAIQQAFLNRFSREYGDFQWATMPHHLDVRPWQWCESTERKILVKPRYTAEIDALQTTPPTDLAERFSYTRKTELRRALRHGVRRLTAVSASEVQNLYLETLAAQGQAAAAERRMQEIATIHELTSTGYGFQVVCTQGDVERARSVWQVLLAKGRACVVVAAADSTWRSSKYNAYSCLQALVEAQANGADCFDFNGANSPQRGPDKHSYGAEAALYFDLQLVKTSRI